MTVGKRPVTKKRQAKKATRQRGSKAAIGLAKGGPRTRVKAAATHATLGPVHAAGSPKDYRVRVRMYRQGLGDCFLLTFPRAEKRPLQMLIDCGSLERTKREMVGFVEHIKASVLSEQGGGDIAELDVVVATHEHKDHLAGFNQARDIFSDEFRFHAVWLAWTENLTKPAIRRIKDARRKAVQRLEAAASMPGVAQHRLKNACALLGFSSDDDNTGTGRIADALEYLKLRGRAADALSYLEPGDGPLTLDEVADVRVFVLGPPRDPLLLKGSEVTAKHQRDHVVYHLASTGELGIDALGASLPTAPAAERDRFQPFAAEHRVPLTAADRDNASGVGARHGVRPRVKRTRDFLKQVYDAPGESWRRIDQDWLGAFDQLALDLDNDTNNTSLVLAFEFTDTGEVLLFVGDAQVGNWLSWADVEFSVPEREDGLPAHDLLERTVFYKVGHHCSHNATLREGGLELMNSENLVAFVPLDRATAGKQGVQGWRMPAAPLYKALEKRTGGRVVLSDKAATLPPSAVAAGVKATATFIDYFLR